MTSETFRARLSHYAPGLGASPLYHPPRRREEEGGCSTCRLPSACSSISDGLLLLLRAFCVFVFPLQAIHVCRQGHKVRDELQAPSFDPPRYARELQGAT